MHKSIAYKSLLRVIKFIHISGQTFLQNKFSTNNNKVKALDSAQLSFIALIDYLSKKLIFHSNCFI